ncbi:MAG: ATP-binding protein [Thermodesulfobacteriota bacterium]
MGMDLAERLHLLRATDIFQGLTLEEMTTFAKAMEELQAADGTVVVQEGDPGHDMYILVSGRLRIFKNARTITFIEAVDYVGEMAVLEDKPRSASVQAVGPCTLLRITAQQFQDFLAHQPQSLVALMRGLSRRVRRDTEQLADEFEKANILVHDMANVLSGFIYLDVLARESLEPRLADYVRRMKKSRDHLAEMIQEALANAKRLKRPPPSQEVDLVDLVRDVVTSEVAVHPDTRGRQIEVVAEPVPPVACHPLDIRRVVMNLLLNAAQASPVGTPITVVVRPASGWTEIEVIDRGPGIPATIVEKIFEPHFTTKTGGNGLGLPSCQAIIQSCRGTVSFVTTPGAGTIFTVRLPWDGTPPADCRGDA